jgi:hypothetical protein
MCWRSIYNTYLFPQPLPDLISLFNFLQTCAMARSTSMTNITSNLVNRAVAGNKLRIDIHQYYGHRLHLVWPGGVKEAALERLFLWSPECDVLRTELQKTLSEGVCGCVFDTYTPGVPLCTKRTPERKYVRWLLRDLQ